jgi:triphosphoribosyl-dephospho-CoA synthase
MTTMEVPQPGTDALPKARVLKVLMAACRADVAVFKPGNVSVRSPGHGMTARDFLTSAEHALPSLLDLERSLGERVHAAVVATRQAVGCNTNLGILLLLAPLAEAALEPCAEPLRIRVARSLQRIRQEDAAPLLEAIRHAAPGGLGRSEHLDANESGGESGRQAGTIGDAMQHAADRDRIARQYMLDFADVFAIGMAAVKAARRGHETLSAYLSFLTAFDDTHVVRKHGTDVARWVREAACPVAEHLKACENPPALIRSLEGLDEAFKRVGVNPGTSADLTVASLAAASLVDLLEQNDASPESCTDWLDAVFGQQ